MEYLWIAASVLAALCQAVRYAALKALNAHLSAAVASYVRVLFGLPLLIAHLVATLWLTGIALPAIEPTFLVYCLLAALSQFVGTMLMMQLFRIGNFAVGTMLAKTDVVLTAIVGSVLFSETIALWGWIAILVTFVGVMIASAGRLASGPVVSGGARLLELLAGRSTQIGLLVGLIYAVSYLTLREAILSLPADHGPAVRAAFAGTTMTACSFVVLGGWMLATERAGLSRMKNHFWLCCLVGTASALGTIAWFLASAIANAAYVAAVAQVQVAFTLALSRYWFREPIQRLELAGIGVILAGVLLFRLV